jgi:hypothetical protein
MHFINTFLGRIRQSYGYGKLSFYIQALGRGNTYGFATAKSVITLYNAIAVLATLQEFHFPGTDVGQRLRAESEL